MRSPADRTASDNAWIQPEHAHHEWPNNAQCEQWASSIGSEMLSTEVHYSFFSASRRYITTSFFSVDSFVVCLSAMVDVRVGHSRFSCQPYISANSTPTPSTRHSYEHWEKTYSLAFCVAPVFVSTFHIFHVRMHERCDKISHMIIGGAAVDGSERSLSPVYIFFLLLFRLFFVLLLSGLWLRDPSLPLECTMHNGHVVCMVTGYAVAAVKVSPRI